ncbi:MAG: hypothetical protein QNJ51_20260 [Calothrix sp. MO_167.B12]|nr:hypothetical protein [Calothrix sp. MO_167.B12]
MSKNGLRNFTFHTEDAIDETSRYQKYYSDIEKLATALKKVDLAVLETKKWKSAFQEQGIEKLLKELLRKALSLEYKHDLPRGWKPDTGNPGFIQPNSTIKASAYPRFKSERSQTVENSEFECLGTQEIRFTHTQLVKYQQKYNGIPVYGAQVTVEVDDENELLSINSMIADSIDTVSPEPKIKQEKDIKAAIWEQTGHDLTEISINCTLYYYFDSKGQEWRLVYLVGRKLNQMNAPVKFELMPEMVDYLVDAHRGDWVSQLPRVKTLKKL